jgi:hypothetical protein
MCKQRCGLPPETPLVTCFRELAIACRADLGLSPGKHIERRHIIDAAVQAYGIVVIHVGLNQAQRIFPGQGVPG